MKNLYTTAVKVTGGREGKAESLDGRLAVALALPKELGGNANSQATNPEQLFAAGFAACFESAIRHVARSQHVKIVQSEVEGKVDLGTKEDGTIGLAVSLTVTLPELDKEIADSLVNEAHRVCPYSNATRGNIPVRVTLQQ